jgi:copper oxidase (laccase) domain-containing protein
MPESVKNYIEQISEDQFLVDLPAINAELLREAGVRSVTPPPACTCCSPDTYWSHRKHGTNRGLQVSLIGMVDT